MPNLDVVFDADGMPIVDAVPFARARDSKADWRPEPLPYRVPDHLRLPLEPHTGAPSKYGGCTEDTCRRLEALVINGASVLAAKSMVGLTKMRWRDWTLAAQEGRDPFKTFMARVQMATAYVEAVCTTTIQSAVVHPDANVALKAADTKLRHVAPSRYAPKSRVDHKVSASMTVNINVLQAVLSADPRKLASLAERLAVEGDGAAVPMLEEKGGRLPRELFDRSRQTDRPPRPDRYDAADEEDDE